MEQLINLEIMNSMNISFIAIVSVLVQLSKQYINTHYAPLVSIMFGLLFSLGYSFSGLDVDPNWFIAILRGIIIGLAASGLYSNITMSQKNRS